jgi:hypothetical protein
MIVGTVIICFIYETAPAVLAKKKAAAE